MGASRAMHRGPPAPCLSHTPARRWPKVSRSFCYEVVIGPGDVVYIPPSFWHHVTSLSASISILAPFDMSPREQAVLARPWVSAGWGDVPALPPLLELVLAGGCTAWAFTSDARRHAANGFAVHHVSGKGRGVFAIRDFTVGEVPIA